MMDRRGFLASSAALIASRGWASAASPDYLTAARRPGTFALIIDCAEGRETKRLKAPTGRHFYGHGAFSQDGALLYTTENAFDTGDGRIGVWDGTDGYKRIGEFSSGGIGPHDVKLMPDGETLVVANGGIRTHPDYGREKLNLPDVQPNISYLFSSGDLVEKVEPPPTLRQNSTRHLAVRGDGLIAVASQWQGSQRHVVPLLALHRRGADLRFLSGPDQSRLSGYAGSVAFSGNGKAVAISAPRGGRVQVFNAEARVHQQTFEAEDGCGLAEAKDGFKITSGRGKTFTFAGTAVADSVSHLSFDNHLIRR